MSYLLSGLRREQRLVYSILVDNKRLDNCKRLWNNCQKLRVCFNYNNCRYLSRNTYDWLQSRGIIKSHFPAEK